jgi:hypothetical protein
MASCVDVLAKFEILECVRSDDIVIPMYILSLSLTQCVLSFTKESCISHRSVYSRRLYALQFLYTFEIFLLLCLSFCNIITENVTENQTEKDPSLIVPILPSKGIISNFHAVSQNENWGLLCV